MIIMVKENMNNPFYLKETINFIRFYYIFSVIIFCKNEYVYNNKQK